MVVSRKFPPGKSGGLIEAMGSFVGILQEHDGFRRVNPAASLKLPMACDARRPDAMFPPGKSGGLIEALVVRTPRSPQAATGFPPGKSGGLIEAAAEHGGTGGPARVSAG